MATRSTRKDPAPVTGDDLCAEHFPHGWASVELVVPDAATVSCEHGSFYHPERYRPAADTAEAGEVEAPPEE